ncbi:Methyltransferase-like protein 23 [Nowakowskiella sp. JEL0407]|nr:Methyltransferase-like protein 23 [Nowakowskiella sp. JEL0407]
MATFESLLTFQFSDNKNNKPDDAPTHITLLQRLDEFSATESGYGTYFWPCAFVLSAYVWYNKNIFRNAHVIELGAGTGLPGMLCASKAVCAKRVLLTDYYSTENPTLRNLTESIRNFNPALNIVDRFSDSDNDILNVKSELAVVGLSWGEFTERDFNFSHNGSRSGTGDISLEKSERIRSLFRLIESVETPDDCTSFFNPRVCTVSEVLALMGKRVDFILGSDCFFDPKSFEDCISTVSYLLRKSTATSERTPRFITTYQERSSTRTIEHLLHKWNLQASLIPLTEFGFDQNYCLSDPATMKWSYRRCKVDSDVKDTELKDGMLVVDYNSASDSGSEVEGDADIKNGPGFHSISSIYLIEITLK